MVFLGGEAVSYERGTPVQNPESCRVPEQFDYALRKKGVEKMIVIVSVPPPCDQSTRPGPAATLRR